MKGRICLSASLILAILWIGACKKSNYSQSSGTTPPPGTGNYAFSYGDSILYLQNQQSDYIVYPSQMASGEYSGFPEGIELDAHSGAINVSKSETGLKYQIAFIPQGSQDTIFTYVIISGINYLDGFYNLAQGDSVVKPLYNANLNNSVPGLNNGTIFDEGSGCNNAGCNVNVSNGQINLAQTVRNGVFGTVPSNNDRHEFLLDYRINDKSGKSLNALKVKLYYFDRMSDVTQEVYDIIDSRVGTILGADPTHLYLNPLPGMQTSVNSVTRIEGRSGAAKPRPPCIFIVSH